MLEVMATLLVVVEIQGWNSIFSLSNAWSTWQFSLSETLHYLKHSLGYLGTHLGSRQKTKSYWDLRAPQNHQVDDDYDPMVPVSALHSGPHHPLEGHDGGGADGAVDQPPVVRGKRIRKPNSKYDPAIYDLDSIEVRGIPLKGKKNGWRGIYWPEWSTLTEGGRRSYRKLVHFRFYINTNYFRS